MSTSRRSPKADLEECPCSGATLARLIQPAIMSLLAGGSLHGYRIVQRLAKTPLLGGSRPDPTGVYRMLRIMEKRGLVVSSWDLSDTGPAKRLYRLTPEGRRCLGRWVETLTNYHRAIGKLLALLKPGGKSPASGRARKCGCRKG
jgi:PadR family transcriptional regulator PadR